MKRSNWCTINFLDLPPSPLTTRTLLTDLLVSFDVLTVCIFEWSITANESALLSNTLWWNRHSKKWKLYCFSNKGSDDTTWLPSTNNTFAVKCNNKLLYILFIQYEKMYSMYNTYNGVTNLILLPHNNYVLHITCTETIMWCTFKMVVILASINWEYMYSWYLLQVAIFCTMFSWSWTNT